MSIVTIRGVDVSFPFEPYDCQKDYMGKVLECLQEGKHGVLESPTGTGKTLCLLCSTLAWREAFKANMQLQHKLGSVAPKNNFASDFKDQLSQAANWGSEEKTQGFFDVPRIIYASRTHSQLSQAVQEMKRTAYKAKVAVLGSREQLCINPDVLKQDTNAAKVHMCRAKVQSRACHFYNNFDKERANPELSQEMMDIEDLVTVGKKQNVCPYYLAREMKTTAEVVFMPYNYLLDLKTHKAQNIDVSGSVILFDEAHNLEKNCEDAASFDLSSFDIASCIEDIDACIELKNNPENVASFGEDSGGEDLDPADLVILKAMFLSLEESIGNLKTSSKEAGGTFPGKHIYELLEGMKITFQSKSQILELLDKCNAVLASDQGKAFRGKHFALSKFGDALNIIFGNQDESSGRNNSRNHSKLGEDYIMHVHAEEISKRKMQKLDVWTTKTDAVKEGRTLSYWCFSPGYTMKGLVQAGIRCMILTSGTLSPLQSFTAELKIPIPVTLENPHVIEKHQFCVGLVKKGPDGTALNSSYNNRSNPKYMDSLGNTIVNFSRIIPNGLLVFFPSYPVMNKMLEHWQSTGVWNRIANNKPLFIEPKGKMEFAETMEQFYDKINDPDYKCAVFFAVCRGKVSEGLDFADMNGRAVIITGLPYPPVMDPKVKLKMKFLDENRSKGGKGLGGQQWYCQQATRAVNQAIGRVIRHKNDFGAILLCDERFANPGSVSQLPAWVRPYVKCYNTFGNAQRDISQFFRHMEKVIDTSSIKMKPQRVPLKTDSTENAAKVEDAKKERTGSTVEKKPERSKERARALLAAERRQKMQRENGHSSGSLSKVKIEYEETVPHPVPVVARQSKTVGLLDSLAILEGKQESMLNQAENDSGKASLSDCIMKNKNTSTNSAASKSKKVLKVVREKKQDLESASGSSKNAASNAKLPEAKQYISRLKQTLNAADFKSFTKLLMDYRKNDNFDVLIRDIAPLLGRDHSTFPLLLNFATFVKDSTMRKQFFKEYEKITGQSVPPNLWAEVGVNKRSGSDSSDGETQAHKKTRLS